MCQQIISNWHLINIVVFDNGWILMHTSCGCLLLVFSTGCIMWSEPSPECGNRFTHSVDCYASTELQRLPTVNGQYSTNSKSYRVFLHRTQEDAPGLKRLGKILGVVRGLKACNVLPVVLQDLSCFIGPRYMEFEISCLKRFLVTVNPIRYAHGLLCFVVVISSAPIRSRASIHLANGGLTTRSREVSKPRELGLDFTNRSNSWQTPRLRCCWDACEIRCDTIILNTGTYVYFMV